MHQKVREMSERLQCTTSSEQVISATSLKQPIESSSINNNLLINIVQMHDTARFLKV